MRNVKEFGLEKEGIKIFDIYYKSKGWNIKRITGLENRKRDVELRKDIGNKRQEIWIEEKTDNAYSNEYIKYAPIELIQDAGGATFSRGNFFTTGADYMIVQYLKGHTFYKMYVIEMRKLRQKFNGICCHRKSKYKFAYVKKGYGLTLLQLIEWDCLIKLNIAFDRTEAIRKILKTSGEDYITGDIKKKKKRIKKNINIIGDDYEEID